MGSGSVLSAGVPVEGLEPTLTCVKQILSLSRLPFRHTGLTYRQRLTGLELATFRSSSRLDGTECQIARTCNAGCLVINQIATMRGPMCETRKRGCRSRPSCF